MSNISEKQKKFFLLVKAVQKGKVSPKKVENKIKKAAKNMSKKDVNDFIERKGNIPKEKIKEIIEAIGRLKNSISQEIPNLTEIVPVKPMYLDEEEQDIETERNPIAKTFKQQGNFEEFIQKFSGLEIKPKEFESITNYTTSKPTKMDNYSIRYESSDAFSNNTITVIKKLREGNDLVFTVFQSTQQSSIDVGDKAENSSENAIVVSKSISFRNEIDGGEVLSDVLQKLEI